VTLLDLLGWVGSALLVFSLLQARVLRLRVLNLIACVLLIVFNGLIEVWPMVAMNIALAVINLWFIRKLLAERGDEAAYEVLEVAGGDTYLRHFLRIHAADIATFFPLFEPGAEPESRSAYLVQHGNETAGVVVISDVGGGTAQVELDYVTPRFRDFTPGEFVYRRSGLFTDRGFHRIVTPPGMVGAYYERLGFSREGDSWAAELA
jgi:hypothetical protein